MSIVKDFFEKLKRNKMQESQNPVQSESVITKTPELTLTVFDSSGYEEEKRKAIAELVAIQNGGKFSSDEVKVITRQIVLPELPVGAADKKVSFNEILSDYHTQDLINDSLHEFVIVKQYGPHHAVALLMGKNVITTNVKYQSYYPEDESATTMVVDGVPENTSTSIEQACKNRWGGDYFFSNYDGWKSGNFLKTTLSGYDAYAEHFAKTNDAVVKRTLGTLINTTALNLVDGAKFGANFGQVDEAVELLAEQLTYDVEKYASNADDVVAGIINAVSGATELARYVSSKNEMQK